MTTRKHRHQSKTTMTRGYNGAVSRDENRAAHGGVCLVEFCQCGYVRRSNVNGRHVERGQWQPGDALLDRRRRDAAARLDASRQLRDSEERRRRLMRGEPSWRGAHRTMTVCSVDREAVMIRIEAWDRSRVDSRGQHPHVEDRVIALGWDELLAAARQQDRGLAAPYEQLLADAQALSEVRLTGRVAVPRRGAA